MKYIKVQGNKAPDAIEILGSKKLANFRIKEVIKESEDGEYTIFEWYQIKFNISDSDEYINKIILQNSYNAIADEYEAQVKELTKDVPESEKSTWTKQELEARAYVLDNTYITPFIDKLAITRGVDKEYLVGKIIEKADLYTLAVAELTGLRQKLEDELL